MNTDEMHEMFEAMNPGELEEAIMYAMGELDFRRGSKHHKLFERAACDEVLMHIVDKYSHCIHDNQKGDRAMTTFEDLKPLFHQMSHDELQKTADWLVPDASDIAILTRAWDIKNHTERHM